jgi:predicted deacylase
MERREMKRTYLSFDGTLLRDLEIPYFEAEGLQDGPTLTLIAGVHGCEYTSQAAVRTFMNHLDETKLTGRIRAIPTLNLRSFYARTPFVSPDDSKNLNRCFPGLADGSYSEQLAFSVTERLIAGSDAFVDLHAGDLVEALEPFSLYEESEVTEGSRALAEAYGLRYSVLQRRQGKTVSGASTAAAADLGVPAIIAESGGRGILEEHAVATHLNGLKGVTNHLGMTDFELRPSEHHSVEHFSSFHWIRSEHQGWWSPSVPVGAKVHAGERLGEVLTLLGEHQSEAVAPSDGVVLFMTSSPAVLSDGLLLGLAADPLSA